MSQLSLFPMVEDGMYSDHLPKSGIMQNGSIYAQAILERHTEEKGSSLLPTPTTGSEHRTRYSQGGRSTLCAILEMLPTPTVNDSKNNPGSISQWERHSSLPIEVAKREGFTMRTIGKDSRLNPHFVIEMMGFPIGWLDWKHLETRLYLSVLNSLVEGFGSQDYCDLFGIEKLSNVL